MAPWTPPPPPPPYAPPLFSNTPSIRRMHGQSRFGHENQLGMLLRGTDEQKKSYVVGILALSITIFAIFVAWSILLLCLKCFGRKRVGIWSGDVPELPPRPTKPTGGEDDDDDDGGGGTDEEGEESASAVPEEEEERDDDVDGAAGGGLRSVVSSSTKTPMASSSSVAVAEAAGGGGGRSVGDGGGGAEEEVEIFVESPSPPVADDDSAARASSSTGVDRAIPVDRAASSTARGERRESAVVDAERPETEADARGDDPAERPDEEDYEATMEEWNVKAQRVRRTVRRTRIVVLMAGTFVLIASILFNVKGVASLGHSLNDANEAIDIVERILRGALFVADEYIEGQTDVADSARRFSNESLADWCPGFFNGTNLTDETILLHEALGAVSRAFVDFKLGIVEEVIKLRMDLLESLKIAEEVSGTVNSFTWALWVSAAFGILLLVLVLIIMGEVILAWKERRTKPFRCAHTYLVMPVFVFSLFLAWLFAFVFVMAGVVSADFCFDSPDDYVQYVLEKHEDRFQSIIYQLIIYYISGCKEEYKPPDIDTAFEVAVALLMFVHDFIYELGKLSTQELDEYCGVNATALVAAAHLADDQLHVYLDVTLGLRRILECSNFNPIYINVFYNAICYNGVDGMAWIYVTQLVIAICSMVIVTLRVAWHDVEASEAATVDLARESEHSNYENELSCRTEKSDSSTPGRTGVQSRRWKWTNGFPRRVRREIRLPVPPDDEQALRDGDLQK